MNVNSIYHAALGLSDADRVELAGLLLSSVNSDEQKAVRQAWMEEVDRRREAFLRGELPTVGYDEVMRAARNRATS